MVSGRFRRQALSSACIDSAARTTYTDISILQAGDAGKAVRLGRGPATVIGFIAVSQTTLPCRSGLRLPREMARSGWPQGARLGLFH